MANGEILTRAQATVKEALKIPNTPKSTKAVLETLDLMIIFLKQSNEDHDRVDKLWDAYKIGKWMMAILAGAVIIDFITRAVSVIGKFGF